jgi:hypothetical protein
MVSRVAVSDDPHRSITAFAFQSFGSGESMLIGTASARADRGMTAAFILDSTVRKMHAKARSKPSGAQDPKRSRTPGAAVTPLSKELERSRLIRELAKLDTHDERQLAEEGPPDWPEY